MKWYFYKGNFCRWKNLAMWIFYLDRAFRNGQNDVLDRQKRSPDEWDTSIRSLEESGLNRADQTRARAKPISRSGRVCIAERWGFHLIILIFFISFFYLFNGGKAWDLEFTKHLQTQPNFLMIRRPPRSTQEEAYPRRRARIEGWIFAVPIRAEEIWRWFGVCSDWFQVRSKHKTYFALNWWFKHV